MGQGVYKYIQKELHDDVCNGSNSNRQLSNMSTPSLKHSPWSVSSWFDLSLTATVRVDNS